MSTTDKCALEGPFACIEMVKLCIVKPCRCALKFQHIATRCFADTPYARPQWRAQLSQKRPSRKDLLELTHATMLEF